MRHLDTLPKISFKDNWMKEFDSEVAGGGKDSQQIPPKTKNPIVRTRRPVLSEQQSGSSVQETENVSNLTAKAPMKEQGDLFSSCVSASGKRLDQDKDADEHVDADHVRTKRLVYEQPPGLFTQCEDRYRLQSVWIATCSCETRIFSCSRTREENRESSSSTSSSSCFETKTTPTTHSVKNQK